MTLDHRDLVIGHLAADLLVAENLLTESIIDTQSYRAVAQQAIYVLHGRDGQLDRQQQTIRQLSEDLAHLRAGLVRAAAEAA